MAFADFFKAAFGIIFGYDLDAALFYLQEERKRPESVLDYVPCDDSLDCFACPPPHLSLSRPSPSHTFAGWKYRRFGAV
ncbi:hypothetical protein DICSQDRAFT_173876 [Dichomitus squalens LYAD-421 SS1]|uniref:Uncharacterized protein n=2 Tax=Dichomitus squalens TaxID=114155 RepID=A0A4V2K6N7_9APHY|nr:uncharacterized protein DICSQDRAFT_173876 [Dichomitus squalens LYAD-421 SS1]EJF57537.1 hypothetical protein DICSQDRAFT_173876 [Dichomitus squalens LYAD-421 SS1]TBU52943.1 hypothetical protein BD310DRAFT_981497 [Dichomitus squalens]